MQQNLISLSCVLLELVNLPVRLAPVVSTVNLSVLYQKVLILLYITRVGLPLKVKDLLSISHTGGGKNSAANSPV